MKRRPADRKGNYAAIVKKTMPWLIGGIVARLARFIFVWIIIALFGETKMLDILRMWSIIIFTDRSPSIGWADAGKRFQTRRLAGTRNFESTARRSHRSAVCQGQLFRSQGSCPGQIRDAAPRAERGTFSDGRRHDFRLLPALVLPSAIRFRTGWARRPGPPQTRPQTGAQTHRRGPGLHRRDTPERAVPASAGTGALDPRAFRDKGSSAEYRTQLAAASKKTPLNESGGQLRSTPDLTEQYEQLRREATSHSEHGGEGLGLALFLRRGMTAWMQAWSQCTEQVPPAAHPQPATAAIVPIDLRTQIATLLAGIILGPRQEATS
jgi:hypothetical protein